MGVFCCYLSCYDRSMTIDGRAIAREICGELARALSRFSVPPKLGIVVVGEDPVIENFVRIKLRIANELGILTEVVRFPKSTTTEELLSELTLARSGRTSAWNGEIIQLPLPSHIDTEQALNAIPLKYDVDVLSRESVACFREGTSPVLPPVAGAIQAILEKTHIAVAGKEVLILGHGRLVGKPAELFFRHNGAHVTVIDRSIADLREHMRETDIIVSGVGSPGLITPDMLKPGVVLLDAGTSESAGKIAGDALPECRDVASVFTPVPGGIGPIAVALIFKNLLILSRQFSWEE